MDILQMSAVGGDTAVAAVVVPTRKSKRKVFHRIREVRAQQGISLRTVARHMRTDLRSVRAQEEEDADLRLSELYDWHRALDVPVAELLVESDDELSRPVLERARMVRIMKTAQALLEKAPNPAMKRMTETLVNQLVEVMPELEAVTAWHSVGQRRSLEELGRVAEQTISPNFAREGMG